MKTTVSADNTAVWLFIRNTDSDDISAEAYLPSQYDHCPKCVTREGHSHPMKLEMTDVEVEAAIDQYNEDQFLASVGA